MHTEMWEHPAVQDNVATLRRRGVTIVEPEPGRLAGGDVGTGRLASTEAIVAAIESALDQRPAAASQDLAGLRVLVTAGGTREPIDAVRYVGNRSSGKQGHAVAEAAADRGASVFLVTTTALAVPAGIVATRVETAAEMRHEVDRLAPTCDVVVMAAAVADFRPVEVAEHKIKKGEPMAPVSLEPTVDILAGLGASKRSGQTLVGFAAETDDLVAHARGKLTRKHLDVIVANDVSAPGVGFEHDTNAVTILTASGGESHVPLADKRVVAQAILDVVVATRTTAGLAPNPTTQQPGA